MLHLRKTRVSNWEIHWLLIFLKWLVYNCLASEPRRKSLCYRTIILYGHSFQAFCSVSWGPCTPLELNCNIFIFPFCSAPNHLLEYFHYYLLLFWGTCHCRCSIYFTIFFFFTITRTCIHLYETQKMRYASRSSSDMIMQYLAVQPWITQLRHLCPQYST